MEKIKRKEHILTNAETAIFDENIRKHANWREDNIMSAKISKNDFATKEVKYQERCLTKYQTEAESIFHSKNRKILNDSSSKHSKIYYQWCKEREVYSDV